MVDQRTITALVGGLAVFHSVATAQQLLALFVCTLYTCNLLKATFRIPRPTLQLVPEAGYGFPSAHAAVALAVGLWWVPTTLTGRSIAVLGAVLIGISRLVLLVHSPLDVVGGWLVGYGAWYVLHPILLTLPCAVLPTHSLVLLPVGILVLARAHPHDPTARDHTFEESLAALGCAAGIWLSLVWHVHLSHDVGAVLRMSLSVAGALTARWMTLRAMRLGRAMRGSQIVGGYAALVWGLFACTPRTSFTCPAGAFLTAPGAHE